MKTLLLTIFCISGLSYADKPKIFDLGNDVKVSILEVKFEPSEHKIVPCEGSDIPCLIDGHLPFGTAVSMPRTKLKELKFITKKSTYILETTGMYNAWGNRPLQYKDSIKYLGAHCYTPDNCKLRGIFSDAAGSYVAEWYIFNGTSMRTVLSSSDDITHLIINNVEPPYYD